MEPSATSTTVTGPVGECLQAGTEDAPVLDRPAPLRRLHDSGAGYKYPDLLTYFVGPEHLIDEVQILLKHVFSHASALSALKVKAR